MFIMRMALQTDISCDNGLSGVLSSVLEVVQGAARRGVSGVDLLHKLLSTPWLGTLLEVYGCLLQYQRLPPIPALPYALALSDEVMDHMRAAPCPSDEIKELYCLLGSPHLQALLYSHDSVALADFEPGLSPLPDDLSEDEDAVRVVCLVKNQQPLGATIKKDEETGDISIARVIQGGLADRSGLLRPGDLLVEVNGNPVEGLDPEEVIQMLVNSQGTILFKVIPNVPQAYSNQSPVYMRALVDYVPQQDPAIPCPDAGMSFSKGDLLEVVDQSDANWWQARKLPSTASRAGLIPSTNHFKSKQREPWWCQPFQPHTCSRSVATMTEEPEEETKPVDEKSQPKPDEEECDYEENESDHIIDGIYLAGFRRSFRVWRKTVYRKRRQSCHSCTPNNMALTNPYEKVVTYQRAPSDPQRLIVLLGPSGVGVNELRKRLIKLNPSTILGPVPHTTRPIREGERPGRQYHFITKELFEYMVCNHRFVEYGEHKGHMYGTSTDAVKEVMDQGRMCIIDVEPHSIQSLRIKKLKPFVIYVKPPDTDTLKETRQNARIITKYTHNRTFRDEDFEEMVEVSRMVESRYGQFFDSVVVNDGIQDCCLKLYCTIQLAQQDTQWVPATWMTPDD